LIYGCRNTDTNRQLGVVFTFRALHFSVIYPPLFSVGLVVDSIVDVRPLSLTYHYGRRCGLAVSASIFGASLFLF